MMNIVTSPGAIAVVLHGVGNYSNALTWAVGIVCVLVVGFCLYVTWDQ